MSMSDLIILKLAEELYATDSGAAYSKAEEDAERMGVAVLYPEPFVTIGCGYGPFAEHVIAQCDTVAAELGLDVEYSHQTSDILVTLYCGGKADYAKFAQELGARLKPAMRWVINASKLWPEQIEATVSAL